MSSVRIINADVMEGLAQLEDESVHCVVTSPPYWGLRDYGIPPSVWGGDPDCAHEWGENLLKKGGGGQPSEKRRWQHQGRGPSGHPSAQAGSFCARCTAWRGALGLELDYPRYIEHIVTIFRETRRVLCQDGTVWLNLGDCYATGAGRVGSAPGGGAQGARWKGGAPSTRSTLAGNGHIGGGPKLRSLPPVPSNRGVHTKTYSGKASHRIEAMGPMTQSNRMPQAGLKPKDLMGMPWRVAFALQADGWWLRSALPWIKRNGMPESTRDRPTQTIEFLFMLTKSERYFYNRDAVIQGGRVRRSGNKARKPASARGVPVDTNGSTNGAVAGSIPWEGATRAFRASDLFLQSIAPPHGLIFSSDGEPLALDVVTAPYKDAHFATFPPYLIEPLIKASCPPHGTILDPFAGSGTVGLVAARLNRAAILIDLKADYCRMARERIEGDAPLFAAVDEARP